MAKVKNVNPADVTVTGDDMVTGVSPKEEEVEEEAKEEVKEEVTLEKLLFSLSSIQHTVLVGSHRRHGRISKYTPYLVVKELEGLGLVERKPRYSDVNMKEWMEESKEARDRLGKIDWNKLGEDGVSDGLSILFDKAVYEKLNRLRDAFWLTEKGKELVGKLVFMSQQKMQSQLSSFEKDEQHIYDDFDEE